MNVDAKTARGLATQGRRIFVMSALMAVDSWVELLILGLGYKIFNVVQHVYM